MRWLGRAVLLLAAMACRGTPPGRAQDITGLVDSLRPHVERAAGLRFRDAPRSAMRTRDEVREYVSARLAEDFPPSKQEGLGAAYRLLGLVPDTVDLRTIILEVLTEQVAGYYDPATRTLVGVTGAAPDVLRLTLAHEIVHALQHEVLPLEQLMTPRGNSDRSGAAQAVLEGHAMMVSLRSMPGVAEMLRNPDVWRETRETIQNSRGAGRVFESAPRILREALIFPYLDGAEFIRWWDSARAGKPLPSSDELPVSTEQILHPGRSLGRPPSPAPACRRAAPGSPAVTLPVLGGPPPDPGRVQPGEP